MKGSLFKNNEKRIWDVVVIGGGPAGMMTAIQARVRGRSVLLLEKNEKLGKKLLITGGGRCNVTNNKPEVREILKKYKEGGKFLFSAFSQFAVKESLSFFADRNVVLKEENEGRMFPESNSSQSVWDALVTALRTFGVIVELRCSVSGIQKDMAKGHFIITLVSGEKLSSLSCVVATGGLSHPETGSTGEGFRWLKKLGHTINANNYALVPIAISDSWVKKLGGISLPDVKCTLYSGTNKRGVHTGKLLFTHFGISGPTVLNMSKEVGSLLEENEPVSIHIDLFPKLDEGGMRTRIQTLLISQPNKKIKNVLHSLIPGALVSPLLSLVGIDGDTPNHSVRSNDRIRISALMKDIPLVVSGLLGAKKAVISSGGINLREINFKTMESRIVSGLYAVGDVLDIDRPSGGYSLQLCWTTGFVAGSHV